MVWYSQLFQNFPQFIVTYRVKDFVIVNKAEIDVFLELSSFFDDPVDVGNLISGSSAFSKTSLNIGKFTVHVLLKPGLENFEHSSLYHHQYSNSDTLQQFFQDVSLSGNWLSGIWDFSISSLATTYESTIIENV